MITEDRVTFEIAKLLRDKGFDEPCDYIYDEDNLKWVYHEFIFFSGGGLVTNSKLKDINGEIITAPTLQMAMKWLREVHNMYIEVCTDKAYNLKDIVFQPAIYNKELNCLWESDNFSTYEEAVDAALKYILENLM